MTIDNLIDGQMLFGVLFILHCPSNTLLPSFLRSPLFEVLELQRLLPESSALLDILFLHSGHCCLSLAQGFLLLAVLLLKLLQDFFLLANLLHHFGEFDSILIFFLPLNGLLLLPLNCMQGLDIFV